jgi:CheY-like chemotaxis protein
VRKRIDSRSPAPTYVLLAEDDDEARSVMAAMLQASDYDVVALSDGDELFEHIGRFGQPSYAKPAVIVSDVRMPGRSGLEVLASARSRGVDVPFVLITAYDDASVRAEAAKHGAVAVLRKPLDILEIVDVVGRVARRGQAAP